MNIVINKLTYIQQYTIFLLIIKVKVKVKVKIYIVSFVW